MNEEEKHTNERKDTSKKISDEKLVDKDMKDKIILSSEPIVETGHHQTKSIKPEIKNMEVHHHPHQNHPHKKKWKEYFFEFFMLFLAVFCGFLAENFREHQIEHRREKIFMEAMVEDLKTDVASIIDMNNKSAEVISMADSLIHLIRKPDCDQYGNTIYYLARKITTINRRFELNDRTYEQMKSSGSLRLISDKMVSDSIMSYYAAQSVLKMQEEIQSTRSNSYFDYVGKVFDAAVFQEMLQVYPYDYKAPNGNPALLTHDPAIINEYIGRLHYLGAISAGNSGQARIRIDQTNRLIELIQSKYHLDKSTTEH